MSSSEIEKTEKTGKVRADCGLMVEMALNPSAIVQIHAN